MDVMEKLVDIVCDATQINRCIHSCNHPPCAMVRGIVDALIENGVTMQEEAERLRDIDARPSAHFVHDGPRFANGVDWWHCSNCGRLASGVETRFNYCPWCGARMDGGSYAKAD